MNFILLETGFPIRVISAPSNAWNDPLVLVAMLSVILTIAIWFIAYSTLQESKRTFNLINNPSMIIYSVFIDESRTKKGEYGVGIQMKNSGKTPAHNVQCVGMWHSDETRLLRDPLNLQAVVYQSVPPDLPIHNFIRFGQGKQVYSDGTIVPVEPITINRGILIGAIPLFLRCEIYYTGLNEEENVTYYFGKYDHVEKDFTALRSYAGQVRDCQENIAKNPKNETENSSDSYVSVAPYPSEGGADQTEINPSNGD